MSYYTWHTYGFGFCVDDIYEDSSLSIEKIMELTKMKDGLFEDVQRRINEFCEDEGITYEEVTVDDLDDMFEGDCCDRGLAHILLNVITEIPIVFADDYNGVQYILYCPSYPWTLEEREKNLTKEDIIEIFKKYISVLTDEEIDIDYQSVENGG